MVNKQAVARLSIGYVLESKAFLLPQGQRVYVSIIHVVQRDGLVLTSPTDRWKEHAPSPFLDGKVQHLAVVHKLPVDCVSQGKKSLDRVL